MPLRSKHVPVGHRQVAERQFVDRDEFVAPVHTALREPQRTEPLVLVYYGVAGIGKSRLRRELVRQLAGEPGVLTATLDFSIPSYRQPETALFFLRKTTSEAYQAKFPSFDLAYAVYWQKAHPETPLSSCLASPHSRDPLSITTEIGGGKSGMRPGVSPEFPGPLLAE